MKRSLIAALFAAAVLLSLGNPAAAQAARTFSLKNGDTLTPASPGFDPTATPAYVGAVVIGQAEGGSAPGPFTLWVSFRAAGFDAASGLYTGAIVPQYSSFAVTEGTGRKSVTTSGTIDSGSVTYRLLADGRAEVVGVTSFGLTVWRGKNKSRTAVGSGTLDYGTSAEGSGTLTLNLF